MTIPTNSSPEVEAHIARALKPFGLAEVNPEIYDVAAEALRSTITNPHDPVAVLKRRLLERYEQEDGTIVIPESEIEDRAINAVVRQLSMAVANLSMITTHDDFSCVHETRYAGNLVSEGNKIFTHAKFAATCLEQINEVVADF